MSVKKHSWENAVRLMPRGTQTMSKCPDQFVDGVYPKFALSAKGCYITCEDGEEYLDFMCGLGPIILGYNHAKTNTAITRQMEKGIIFSLPTYLEQELAEMMIEISGLDVQPIFESPLEGDIQMSQANIDLAVKSFGWKPKVDLEDGLRKYINWRKSL